MRLQKVFDDCSANESSTVVLSALRSVVGRYPIQSAATGAFVVLVALSSLPEAAALRTAVWVVEGVAPVTDLALVALAFTLGVWTIPFVEWMGRRLGQR